MAQINSAHHSAGLARRCAAEFLGTLAIVLFGCGAIATIGNGTGIPGHLAVNIVFGLTVAAMIYTLGHISAAHFNPAVSVGFAVAGRFPWKYVPAYVLAQLAGAVVGSALHAVLLPAEASAVHFGATFPTVIPVRAVGIEVLLTFFLMLTIMSVATDRRVNGAVPGLAIGSIVALCGLFGGPLSGCSMNPARSLGPALFAGHTALSNYWIYLLGPIVGAAVGAVCYEAIRGGAHHGQGAPNDLFVALEEARSSSS